VSIDVEELVVDKKRNDIVNVALIHYLIYGPNSQINLSLPTVLRCFVFLPSYQEFIEASLKDSRDWRAIHLLLQRLDRLVRARLV
jgi:hypothetical protein